MANNHHSYVVLIVYFYDYHTSKPWIYCSCPTRMARSNFNHWCWGEQRLDKTTCCPLYRTVLYCTVLYCTVLYCTVLYCTVLYCTVLSRCVMNILRYQVTSRSFFMTSSSSSLLLIIYYLYWLPLHALPSLCCLARVPWVTVPGPLGRWRARPLS